MKKLLLILCLLLSLSFCCVSLAEETAAEPSTEELTARVLELLAAEEATALANAASNVVAQDPMTMPRSLITGYAGSKTVGSLQATYSISDSMISIGETVSFNVEVSARKAPVVYGVSGLILDENFNKISEIEPQTYSSFYTSFSDGWTYTAKRAGYVSFIFVAVDGYYNELSLFSCTVQISPAGTDPLFDNYVFDMDLGARLSLDRKSIKVGETITATVDIQCVDDPVGYVAGWTLYDAAGNRIDATQHEDLIYASSGRSLTFSYTPQQAGEALFLIVAEDDAGNNVSINTPSIPVEDDGFVITVSVDKKSLQAGESATAAYAITGGHVCDSLEMTVGTMHYNNDGLIDGWGDSVYDFSGTFTMSPRYGTTIGFYADAWCDHYPYAFAEDLVTLIGGLNASVRPNASSAVSGSPVSVSYSVSGGMKPYQAINVFGRTYDDDYSNAYSFMQRPGAAASGTETGTPYLGTSLLFMVEVIEADGTSTMFYSNEIPLSGAPETTAPSMTASLNRQSITLGETVTASYRMTGGTGTIFSGLNGATGSYVAWTTADYELVQQDDITAVSGSSSFKPEMAGSYRCIILMMDGYGQECYWESDLITVAPAPVVTRIPGDANEDGSTNIADALLVLQYDAGWGVSLNASNADVNADGMVDISDALLLLQYDAGWDVTLK